jgi:inositol oxygenase
MNDDTPSTSPQRKLKFESEEDHHETKKIASRAQTPAALTSDTFAEESEAEFNPFQTARTEPFRNYEDSARQKTVENFYHDHHVYQTYSSVLECADKFLKLSLKRMTLKEALTMASEIVDDSDPDTEANQLVHLLQTGESLKAMFPGDEYDWLHLTGFLHDLGKIIASPKMYNLPQVYVVGDIHPVGCAFSSDIVFSQFLQENPDSQDARYNTKYGVYHEGIGLENVKMTFGHDEYFYNVCVKNNCRLPEEALYIIRYHSFYSWHTYGAYDHLCNDKDRQMLEWVRKFQKHDLYSKLPEKPDPVKCLPYYERLIEQYFPERVLKW